VVARVSHFASGLFVVAASDLVLTLPRGIAEPLVATLSLALLDPPLELPDNLLVMTWHERFEEDPANKWLRSAVVRVNDRMKVQECCEAQEPPSPPPE
jgi:DNA-binding transcriptional LysR family regulator